ncbi:MAG: ABC transporter substrate-binding protein [Pyrobaculum sp.]
MNKTFLGIVLGLVVGLAFGFFVGSFSTAPTQKATAQACPTSLYVIKKRGVLAVGTSADWPPYEYIEHGQIVGIDIDIVRKIADSLGVRLEIRDMKFAGLIEAVKKGDVDLIIAEISITPERETQVLFSIPYQVNPSAVVTTATAQIKTVENLKGKTIGVQLGTVQEEWAMKTLGNYSKIVSFDRVYPYMVEALKKGDLDAIVVGEVVARVITSRNPELKIVFTVVPRYSAIAMPLCAYDLKLAVDRIVYDMLQTGEIEHIINRWVEKWLSS